VGSGQEPGCATAARCAYPRDGGLGGGFGGGQMAGGGLDQAPHFLPRELQPRCSNHRDGVALTPAWSLSRALRLSYASLGPGGTRRWEL